MTKKILVVEDHPGIRDLVALTFEGSEFEVHEAPDGATGLALARTLRPDIVLLDVMMPGGIDGLQVCRELRGDPSMAGVRIIILTARSQREDIEAGQAAGADAYVIKPFSPMSLAQLVRSFAT